MHVLFIDGPKKTQIEKFPFDRRVIYIPVLKEPSFVSMDINDEIPEVMANVVEYYDTSCYMEINKIRFHAFSTNSRPIKELVETILFQFKRDMIEYVIRGLR